MHLHDIAISPIRAESAAGDFNGPVALGFTHVLDFQGVERFQVGLSKSLRFTMLLPMFFCFLLYGFYYGLLLGVRKVECWMRA